MSILDLDVLFLPCPRGTCKWDAMQCIDRDARQNGTRTRGGWLTDASASITTTPTDGQKFRPEAVGKSGKSQFPFMIDPNTKVEMLESADICQYLVDTYGVGDGKVGGWVGYHALVTVLVSCKPTTDQSMHTMRRCPTASPTATAARSPSASPSLPASARAPRPARCVRKTN